MSFGRLYNILFFVTFSAAFASFFCCQIHSQFHQGDYVTVRRTMMSPSDPNAAPRSATVSAATQNSVTVEFSDGTEETFTLEDASTMLTKVRALRH